jgi:hypothetical protein
VSPQQPHFQLTWYLSLLGLISHQHDGGPLACVCWLQVLEISTREGNLAVGQLEETKKRLCNTQNQLDAMSDSHARTLSRLETAKVGLTRVVSHKPCSQVNYALPAVLTLGSGCDGRGCEGA